MNYKVYVKDEETSKKVQEHAFKLGYKWSDIYKGFQFLDCPFLFFDEELFNKSISYVSKKKFKYFNEHENKELTLEEFLALPILNVKNSIICPVCGCYYTTDHIPTHCHNCGCPLIISLSDTPNSETYCPRCNVELKLSTLKQFGRCPSCHLPFMIEEKNEKEFDIKNMTEIQAYEIARDMWKFLSENPDKKKCDWEYFNTYNLKGIRGECVLCYLYHKYGNDTQCKGCYLKEKEICDNITGRNYMSWAKGVDKKENATIIYNALKEKCDQLNSENKFDVDSMTEMVAVTISKDLWEFLKENPLRNKLDWGLASKYRIKEMKSQCPLCHFYKDCLKCFLNLDCLTLKEGSYINWLDATRNGNKSKAKGCATNIFNIIENKQAELLKKFKEENNKYKDFTYFIYTHEQIMTGWFRVPSRDDVGSWFRVWVFNPNEKKYGVTADRTVRYTREEFNDWEYSELPPE